MKLLSVIIFLLMFIITGNSCLEGIADFADEKSHDTTAIPIQYRSPVPLHGRVNQMFERSFFNPAGTDIVKRDTTSIQIEPVITLGGSALTTHFDTTVLNSYNSHIYFCSYKWEHDSLGKIVAFYQPENETLQSGVVIAGTFTSTDTTLLDSPVLWIPYPVENKESPGVIDGDSATYEFQSVESVPDQFGILRETYCYRSGSEGNYHYFYYEISLGLRSVLEYRDGVRFSVYKQI